MTHFTLDPEEYAALEDLTAHTHLANEVRRAQALLGLDDGDTIQEVAQRFRVSRQTVYNWVSRFQQRSHLDLGARLSDADRSGRPRSAYGIIDPWIEQVIDCDPRDLGFRCTTWTAPLLEQYLRKVHRIEVSDKSVSRAIARLGIRWKRPRHQLALRPSTWRQAKGGLNVGSHSGCEASC
jgi:transposase